MEKMTRKETTLKKVQIGDRANCDQSTNWFHIFPCNYKNCIFLTEDWKNLTSKGGALHKATDFKIKSELKKKLYFGCKKFV